MKIDISISDIIQDVSGDAEVFPKYTTQIINLANQNAQGTRPKIVGQMSELIQECPGHTYDEWVEWYEKRMPTAIEDATKRISDMMENIKKACGLIDSDMIQKWVRDLVLLKTYVGIKFQASVIKKIANLKNQDYRLATPEEESLGIDGYIGGAPISIKPETYKTMKGLHEDINVKIIYYEKKKDTISIEFDF